MSHTIADILKYLILAKRLVITDTNPCEQKICGISEPQTIQLRGNEIVSKLRGLFSYSTCRRFKVLDPDIGEPNDRLSLCKHNFCLCHPFSKHRRACTNDHRHTYKCALSSFEPSASSSDNKNMETSSAVDALPQVTFKKRNSKVKSTIRKRTTPPPPASDSESGFTSSEDDEGRQIKRRRKNGGVVASSLVNNGSRVELAHSPILTTSVPTNADNATKATNWYDEKTNETRARQNAAKPTDGVDSTSTPDGTYKGIANYQSFVKTNPDRMTKNIGPQKSSTNVRTITVTDFAPDVCKDYKKTGFCGFGDSCKFLHAREDYKQGWEIDREWDVGTKGKRLGGKTVASANRTGTSDEKDDDEEALLESIPFACIICKQSYRNPIMTKCGHYFCESCALNRYRKDPTCAACGTGTGGVFNGARKLNRLLDKKRERANIRREKAIENSEEVKEKEDTDQP